MQTLFPSCSSFETEGSQACSSRNSSGSDGASDLRPASMQRPQMTAQRRTRDRDASAQGLSGMADGQPESSMPFSPVGPRGLFSSRPCGEGLQEAPGIDQDAVDQPEQDELGLTSPSRTATGADVEGGGVPAPTLPPPCSGAGHKRITDPLVPQEGKRQCTSVGHAGPPDQDLDGLGRASAANTLALANTTINMCMTPPPSSTTLLRAMLRTSLAQQRALAANLVAVTQRAETAEAAVVAGREGTAAAAARAGAAAERAVLAEARVQAAEARERVGAGMPHPELQFKVVELEARVEGLLAQVARQRLQGLLGSPGAPGRELVALRDNLQRAELEKNATQAELLEVMEVNRALQEQLGGKDAEALRAARQAREAQAQLQTAQRRISSHRQQLRDQHQDMEALTAHLAREQAQAQAQLQHPAAPHNNNRAARLAAGNGEGAEGDDAAGGLFGMNRMNSFNLMTPELVPGQPAL